MIFSAIALMLSSLAVGVATPARQEHVSPSSSPTTFRQGHDSETEWQHVSIAATVIIMTISLFGVIWAYRIYKRRVSQGMRIPFGKSSRPRAPLPPQVIDDREKQQTPLLGQRSREMQTRSQASPCRPDKIPCLPY